MKPALFVASAMLALSSAPAMADNGQVFDHAAQLRAYSNETPRDSARQCFNGAVITGVNRTGDQTLYVQTSRGGIYQVRLAEGCAALNVATKINLRSGGSDVVCPGDSAEMLARTATGPQSCHVSSVRRLTSGEVSALSTAARR
jgi:hypothetical protein